VSQHQFRKNSSPASFKSASSSPCILPSGQPGRSSTLARQLSANPSNRSFSCEFWNGPPGGTDLASSSTCHPILSRSTCCSPPPRTSPTPGHHTRIAFTLTCRHTLQRVAPQRHNTSPPFASCTGWAWPVACSSLHANVIHFENSCRSISHACFSSDLPGLPSN